MRIHTLCVSAVLTLVACGGKSTAQETPNSESYGKTVQSFHQIPTGDQEDESDAKSTEEKSNY